MTFFGTVSSLLSPLQFQRSQNVYISSYLQLNCNASLSTNIKWTVKQCLLKCSTEIQLDPSIITTSSELFIPVNTLLCGTYELKLTVTMTASPSMTSTAFVYVTIISSSITANLIRYGTSMIVNGYQQDLKLNPGRYSVDPDSNTFNASVSGY